MQKNFKEIIHIANELFPTWNEENRKEHNVFARMLIFKALRRVGMKVEDIGNIFNKHHTTVTYLSNRDIRTIFLKPKERLMMCIWDRELHT